MLQTRTVEPSTLGLLKELMLRPFLDHFFLVGGTALALQMGHRASVDLDLFTVEDFDQDELLTNLSKFYNVIVEVKSPSIFITRINEVKVDFVRFRYKTLYPVQKIEGVRMLEIKDIAPMKLDAVAKRGSKKDFYDFYFLLEKLSLHEMLELYSQKFQHSTVFHIIKSLTYFADAEEQPDPITFDKKIKWEFVKDKILKTVEGFYN